MSIVEINEIDGDLTVGRNVNVGGRFTIQGSSTVEHDLRVKGWLFADNVSSESKGVYESASELEAAYPNPPVGAGWFAGVIVHGQNAVLIYTVNSSGEWVSSGEFMTFSCDVTDLPNKADKVIGATSGNFASLDSFGNLTDSGHKHSDYATAAQGNKADTAYQKPSGGIPKSDLSSAVKTSLGKADTAYQKPSGGIPKSDLSSAVKTSLDKADTALQSHQDISGKADKVIGATSGNFAGLGSGGNLTDSGKKASDFSPSVGESPLLVAGSAKTLVGAEQVEAHYAMRTTDGDYDVGSGYAEIDKMIGNTVLMRQMVENGDFQDATGWNTPGNNASMAVYDNVLYCHPNVNNGKVTHAIDRVVKGHKYLLSFDTDVHSQSNLMFGVWCGSSRVSNSGFFCDIRNIPAVEGWQHIDVVGVCPYTTEHNNANVQLARGISSVAGDYPYSDILVRNVMLFDLTRMFGLGMEPNANEFHRMFPLDYYRWSANVLELHNVATGIKTVGFNQYNHTESVVHVIRGEKYEVVGNYTSIQYPDGTDVTVIDGFFTPDTTDYLTVVGGDSETCIHLVWSGKRNGESEAYCEWTKPIDITGVTGKLNGEGASVTIFPDGMMSIGGYCDEMYGSVAIKRINKIGATDLEFTMDAGTGAFVSNNIAGFIGSSKHTRELIIVCNKYENTLKYGTDSVMYDPFTYSRYNDYDDQTCGAEQSRFAVKDMSYSTLSDFLSSLRGVEIYYVLATPEVYQLDEAFEGRYQEDDMGTEEMIPQSAAKPTSAPVRYTVSYPINAVDRIRRLNKTMISLESFENFCSSLSTALGTALEKSITITPAYSEMYDNYSFNITVEDLEDNN